MMQTSTHHPRPRTTSVSYNSYNTAPSAVLRSKTADGEGMTTTTTTITMTMPSRSPPSRPSTPRTQIYDADGPWKHMAHTYAWVLEQEFVRLQKDGSGRTGRRAEHWMLKPSGPVVPMADIVDGVARQERVRRDSVGWRKAWEELVCGYREEGTRWMKHEEEVRRMAVEREKAKMRLVQDEVRKIEDRIRQRREDARRKVMEERRKTQAEMEERERRERTKVERAVVDRWTRYEARWAALVESSEPITFGTIPWPMVRVPTSATGIKLVEVVQFLFSPLHSKKQSRKERIRSAQLRWHPDRFGRLLHRVPEEERMAVEEGVGAVARCLNDLMARETKNS